MQPMLHVTRLDFTSTLNVMLDLCESHRASVTEKQQPGIADLIFCFNTALRSIEVHNLAPILNSSTRANGHQPEAPEKGPAPVQPAAQPAAQPPTAAQPDGADGAGGLTPGQHALLRFLKAHPLSTTADIIAQLNMAKSTISTYLSAIKRNGIEIQRTGNGRSIPYRYTIQ